MGQFISASFEPNGAPMLPRFRSWSFGVCLLASVALAGCSASSPTSLEPTTHPAAASATKLALNDVSILFPAHQPDSWDAFVKPSDVGDKGELLPAALVEKATALSLLAFYGKKSTDTLSPPERMTLGRAGIGLGSPSDLRVVSMRIDPCFPAMSTDDRQCTRQIRLVWQSKAFREMANDTAVHTLHTLSDSEFRALVHDLVQLKTEAGGRYDDEPLQVQPILAKDGMQSAYAQGVLGLVRKYAGVSNMSRLAFFDFLLFRQRWLFGAYDIQNGNATVRPVATLGSEYQTLDGFAPAKTTTSSAPPFAAADNADLALRNMRSDTSEARQGYESLLRIENPTLVSTETTDCASCHVSTTARVLMESKLGLGTMPSASRFQTSWNTTNAFAPALEDTSFHSFSFFEKPTISQRTVHESALVADWCNRNVLGR
jgi:hypothetical protein